LIPDATSIQVGPIDTTRLGPGGGNITVATATPVLQSTAACNPCVVIDNTAPLTTGGALINSSTITAGEVQQMSVETGDLVSRGGTITVTAGRDARIAGGVVAGNILGAGGTVNITTNSSTPFVVGGLVTTNGVTGQITVEGSFAASGTINITSN